MTKPDETYTLYSYFRSSASARVRTLMALQDIPYDVKFIHLLKQEQSSDEYTKLNGSQTVPTLVVQPAQGDKWNLGQCIAIMEYLDEKWGPGSKVGRLLPADAKDRALVRSIVDQVVGDLFPMLNSATLGAVTDFGGDKIKWAEKWSDKFLMALERLVSKTSTTGKYCYGHSLTLADVALAPQMYTVLRFYPQALDKVPTVKSIFENISKIPEFVKADYKHQPDTPDDIREN